MPKLMLGARLAVGFVMTLVLSFSAAEAKKEDGQGRITRGSHCISPRGSDLNELFGVTEAIVTPFCNVVPAGERWWPVDLWVTADSWLVIPEGFTPTGATPIEDFNGKFAGARYVVDPGTKREQTYRFSSSILRTGFSDPAAGIAYSWWLAQLNPVSVGHHVVDIYITMRGDHWDGFGSDPGNHLPAGEFLYDQFEFEVVSLAKQ